MITARGCPYAKCHHCFQASSSKVQYRRHSPERVIEEILQLADQYRIKEISFWDDAFTVNEEWVLDFCSLLKKRKVRILWSCFGMIHTVSQRMLQAMHESGCWNIFYGLDTGVPSLLESLNRGYTLGRMREVVQWTKNAGIEIRGSFMLGLPGETPRMAHETIRFALDLDLDFAQFSLTTPFPGTRFYEICKDEGTVDTDFSKYTAFEPVFVPKGYSNRNELKAIQQSAYKRFFNRPSYILKNLKKIRRVEDLRRLYAGLKLYWGISDAKES